MPTFPKSTIFMFEQDYDLGAMGTRSRGRSMSMSGLNRVGNIQQTVELTRGAVASSLGLARVEMPRWHHVTSSTVRRMLWSG